MQLSNWLTRWGWRWDITWHMRLEKEQKRMQHRYSFFSSKFILSLSNGSIQKPNFDKKKSREAKWFPVPWLLSVSIFFFIMAELGSFFLMQPIHHTWIAMLGCFGQMILSSPKSFMSQYDMCTSYLTLSTVNNKIPTKVSLCERET